VTFTNGAHIDSLDPATLNRMYDFLELYVAKQAPLVDSAVIKAAAPVLYQEAMGLPKTDLITLPNDPIQLQPTYEGALKEFEALPPVRVLFDNGAGKAPLGNQTAGDPYPGFEQSFSKFPIPGTKADTWYFGANGTLNEHQSGEGSDTYTSDANATPKTDFGPNTGGGGLWGNATQWEYNWAQLPSGDGVSYVSPPLTSNTTAIGGGAVQLWVKSSTPDVDFQATVSEVRPDGNETFVQDGWMRASERKLASSGKDNIFKQKPTVLQPIPTLLPSDVEPMPANEYVPVTIPLYFEGHAYRAGSRIRVTISAPNGTQPIWAFEHTEPEGTTASESIAFSSSMPSSLTLPIVPGVSVPTELPACPSLRNEPCRTYQAIANDGA
jgi:hypothetical protein